MSTSGHGKKDAVCVAAAGGTPGGAAQTSRRRRFFAQHKAEAVLRLLRGEDVDLVSRELGIPAATLSKWREAFVAGGIEGLRARTPAEEAELRRLNEKIGEQTMEIELLREKIRVLESKHPFAWRRSST